FSPPSAGPGVSASVIVSSAALSSALRWPPAHHPQRPTWALVLTVFLLASVSLLARDRTSRIARAVVTAALLATCLFGVFSCGGGGGSGSTPSPGPASYTVTITGISGSLVHTTSFTLNVTN